ncbi:MAG: hypothetical protein KDD36_12970 [Flavobacteriales bacterium]|nr:hypothetical protein [Flavobacteriales bacterium]
MQTSCQPNGHLPTDGCKPLAFTETFEDSIVIAATYMDCEPLWKYKLTVRIGQSIIYQPDSLLEFEFNKRIWPVFQRINDSTFQLQLEHNDRPNKTNYILLTVRDGKLIDERTLPHHVHQNNKQLLRLEVDSAGSVTAQLLHPNADIYLQQFRWNRWINTDSCRVAGKDTVTFTSTLPLHSGVNMFRLIYKQTEASNPEDITELGAFSFSNPTIKKVTMICKPIHPIVFSDTTQFELYHTSGKITRKGRGRQCDISDLPEGLYYVNFDNQTGEFLKR